MERPIKVKNSKKVMQAKFGVSTHLDEDIMFDEEEGSEGWIPKHLVGVRAAMLKVLRNTTEEKLDSVEGEAEILEELRLVINEHLERYEKTTAAPIEEVYFTELIVQ